MSKSLARKRPRYSEVHSPELTLSQGSVAEETVDISEWSCDRVAAFLEEHGHNDVAKRFKEEEIDGEVLPDVDLPKLQHMNIGPVGKCLKVLQLLKCFRRDAPIEHSYKVFNDPIHGHIELDPLCVRIVDTPQFQRLRYIKQLGGCYFVFPGASHNRFEHSLGVCYLAGRLVGTLNKRQPELGITEQDILCVKIAGLCHDLGHGPFSHMFDSQFIPRVRPDKQWRHEDASVQMFDHLIASNNLKSEFQKYGLSDTDIEFIKEQITGQCQTGNSEWPYRGRDESKAFLYEIVANKRSGIDVDKWDYFARDCYCLGISNNFDHRRFMKFARVLSHDDRLQICTRDKEVGNLYDMFHTRNSLHRRAYQHKTANVIELMITEALVKANDHLWIPGKDGCMVKMSDAIDDMVAYTHLTDYVYHQILFSTDKNLQEAREILQWIERRELYRCVAQSQAKDMKFGKEDKAKAPKEIIEALDRDHLDAQSLTPLSHNDILVDFVKFDYGMDEKNPIDSVRFYVKNDPDRAVRVRKDQVSQMLPEHFAEVHIRVYCRLRDDKSCQFAFLCFRQWCENKGFSVPKEGDVLDMGLTPSKTPLKRKDSGSEGYSSGDRSHLSAAKKSLRFAGKTA